MKAQYLCAVLFALSVSAAPVAPAQEKRQLGGFIPDGVLPENVQNRVDAVRGVVQAFRANDDADQAAAADQGAANQANTADVADNADAGENADTADAADETAAGGQGQNGAQQIRNLVQDIIQRIQALRANNNNADAAN